MSPTTPHVLQIVIKNTSTLDFSVPLLMEMRRQHPDWKISVLYCDLSKSSILRQGNYFSRVFKEYNIQEYDFSDYLPSHLRRLGHIWRNIFSRPTADYESFDNFRYHINRLGWSGLKILFGSVSKKIREKLKGLLSLIVKPISEILQNLKPDLVLFDNRSTVNFKTARSMYDFFDAARVPVVLLPHAPHYIREEEGFMPFDPENPTKRPQYLDVWLPLLKARPESDIPDVKYARVGYPAFDEKFLRNFSSKSLSPNSPKKILYIGRKFLEPGVRKPNRYDPFTLEYSEVFQQLKRISRCLADIDPKPSLVIKPHPSSNFIALRRLLKDVGLGDAEISHEPFYGVIPQIDLCISPFSTSSLIPLMLGRPTIFLNDPLQKWVNAQWNTLNELYSGMSYFLHHEEELLPTLKQALERETTPNRDLQHMRTFYPEGALSRCLDRVKENLSETL